MLFKNDVPVPTPGPIRRKLLANVMVASSLQTAQSSGTVREPSTFAQVSESSGVCDVVAHLGPVVDAGLASWVPARPSTPVILKREAPRVSSSTRVQA